MDPVTLSLIVALIGAAEKITPEIVDLINQWKSGQPDLTADQIAQIDAALKGDRKTVAEIYRRNGVA